MENPVVATVLADTASAASADRAVRVEETFPHCVLALWMTPSASTAG